MSSHPGPKRQIEKEWNNTSLNISKRLNIDAQNLNTTQVAEKIKTKDSKTYELMTSYLNAYQRYVSYIKDVNEQTVSHYFDLEDDMNQKRQILNDHLATL